MSVSEIPIRSDLPSYKFSIILDEISYVFQFDWNTRMNAWLMAIKDEFEEPILLGQPVLTNYDLFKRFKHRAIPRGRLYFFDTSLEYRDPERFDLGQRVILIYDNDEVA